MHKLTLTLHSSALQYLSIGGLPPTAASFTVLVNSMPTKPVVGEKGGLSVPLLVGAASEGHAGGSRRSSVELSYLSSGEPLGLNGTLRLPPPSLTIPISVLSVELRLPKGLEYNFSGSFGNESVAKLDYSLPRSVSYQKAKKVTRKGHNFDADAGDDPVLEDATRHAEAAERGVKVEMPRKAGLSFFFQKLLVVDTALTLNVDFAPPPPPPPPPLRRPWWNLV